MIINHLLNLIHLAKALNSLDFTHSDWKAYSWSPASTCKLM